MLPDLWPAHGARRTPLDYDQVAAAVPATPGGRALRAGLLNHRDADAAFHGSVAFADWRRALRPSAERAIARSSVAGFLAHVAIELSLDRLLLLEDPGLGPAFYASLDAVAPEALERELEPLVGSAARGYGATFAAFRRRQHLLDYAERAPVAASIHRVFGLLRESAPRPPADLEPFLAEAEAVLREGAHPATRLEAWLSLTRESDRTRSGAR